MRILIVYIHRVESVVDHISCVGLDLIVSSHAWVYF